MTAWSQSKRLSGMEGRRLREQARSLRVHCNTASTNTKSLFLRREKPNLRLWTTQFKSSHLQCEKMSVAVTLQLFDTDFSRFQKRMKLSLDIFVGTTSESLKPLGVGFPWQLLTDIWELPTCCQLLQWVTDWSTEAHQTFSLWMQIIFFSTQKTEYS